MARAVRALSQLRVPMMVLSGAQDTTPPVKRQAFLAGLIGTAGLRVIEGAGCMPPLEAPGEVTEALAGWLSAPARQV